MAATYIPERGDIVWLEFSPQAGHEQAGHRPAFVVSPGAYHRKVGLARAQGVPDEVVAEVTARILALVDPV